MLPARFAVAFIVLLAVFSTVIVEAQSAAGTGSVELTIAGRQIPGELTNSTLYPDNTVTMSMIVDYSAQTNIGQVTITATGNWYGRSNGTSLAGIIYSVKGTVQICYVFYCPAASYVGYGTWNGALTSNRTQAAGTFEGTLIFTNSQIQNVTLHRPITISGTWNSTLQTSS